MKTNDAQHELDAISQIPGILGCAFVEIETGMVWLSSGNKGTLEHYAEAASDYWRLNSRLIRHFPEIGDLQNISMVHSNIKIAMWRLHQNMVTVIIMDKTMKLDWESIKPRLIKIKVYTNN